MESRIVYPTSEEIEPEHAKHLFEYCAILIVEELASGSEFGIDLVVHRVGDKFKGVKLIPPGIHFVYASSINYKSLKRQDAASSSNCGPRCGFYHNFKPRELLVKRWSAKDEEFDQEYKVDEPQYERYKANLEDLDSYLGCYSYSTYKSYINLTSKISKGILDTLNPSIKLIRSIPFLVNTTTNDTQPSSSSGSTKRSQHEGTSSKPTSDDTLLPDFKPDQKTVINFTKIPKNHIESKEVIPHEMITKYYLDTSLKLQNTFGKDEQGLNRLLGELQYAFVTFLLCHVYECFEQWKAIVGLICGAREALVVHPKFFQEFCDIITYQMSHIPGDMFVDIVDSNNLLRTMLDTFFMNIADFSSEVPELQIKANLLRDHVKNKFNWEFDLELDEEQCVIVELD